MEISEEVRAAAALEHLALQLRRHYYHLPYEQAPDDLIQEGLVVNLEWDDRDALWLQFDSILTLEIPPAGSPLGVYAEEGSVVTLWRTVSAGETEWMADWDVELTQSERKNFLRRLSQRAQEVDSEIDDFIKDYLSASLELEADDRQETADVVREWLSAR
jgi:hypothetical protein